MTTIERIEVRRYRAPLERAFPASWDPVPRAHVTSCIVRVEASGAAGVGSATALPGLEEVPELFVGRELDDMARHARVLDQAAFYYGRLWALEVALWDALGQARGEPVWRMLMDGGGEGAIAGGVKASPPSPIEAPVDIPVYASTGARVSRGERVEACGRLVEEGFRAIKLRMYHEDPSEDIETVRAVRDAVGPEVALLADANQAWRPPGDLRAPWRYETALEVARALVELGVFWLEEPLDRHDVEGLARLREKLRQDSGRVVPSTSSGTVMKIAGGEGARDLGELRDYLRHGSLDVYQPDVAWSTGVLGGVAIAREARSAGVMYTPHTWGDGLVLLANLHVCAAVGAGPWVEYAHDPPWWPLEGRDFMLREPIAARGGAVTLSGAPGLGAEVDWKAIERWRL